MSILPWVRQHDFMNAYCRFLVRHRALIALLTVALTLPWALLARHVTLSSKMTDYYPGRHPHIRLYQDFTEMLKMTNAVVVTVTVREGTIYTQETLAKIHRITVDLLETKGVNPFEVMSLTHPRLKDIKVGSAGINIQPVVNHPDEPQTPEALARIKNAVYTNLGIRGVYVSPDDKTALIRAGFWDGMAEPRLIAARLQAAAERERDANTEIAFAGNLVLAAWLIDAAPRFLLLLFVSAVVMLLFTSQTLGLLSALIALLVLNLTGALWGFGFLGARGLTLDPLALLLLFPLCARGVALITGWHARLAGEYQAVGTPFAGEASRERALMRTGAALWRPLTASLCADGAGMVVLILSDVPALQALGYLSGGWIVGLLLALWTVLPLWSSVIHLRTVPAEVSSWGERLTTRLAHWLRGVLQPSLVTRCVLIVVSLTGLMAALQLEAGRAMMGTTLLYPSHPYNRAFALINKKFIGINQLIVIARTTDDSAFRDPHALQTLDAFQRYMADDDAFGGAVAITGLAKSITRMFHEDIPKWEIIPDDINAAGQVIFRIITAAATPSEVERFLSTDFRTTTVTLFYRDYSPDLVARILARAQEFTAPHNGVGVEFRLGGGLLGILAAVHSAVEAAYWRTLGTVVVLAALTAFLGLGTLQAGLRVTATILLSQAIMLTLLWLGNIDLNMYTLPVIVVSLGTPLIPAFLAGERSEDTAHAAQGLAATSLVVASAASIWLFSPLRLQAEMGVFLILLALANTIIPLQLQKGGASQ
jgi:predicted RND superfamily exporter protein